MNFREKNTKSFEFNMSSMTDIVFLLLVFFMLTSNFATPSGLNISVPTSKSSKKVLPKITISVTQDLRYFVNETELPFSELENYLKLELDKNEEKGSVILAIDKEVTSQHFINVVSIATKLKAKVVISTKPINK